MSNKISADDHKKRGTFRPSRHADPGASTGDPGASAGDPGTIATEPLWLSETAAGIYRQVVGELSEEKVLRKKHLHLIAMFSALYGAIQEALMAGEVPKPASITALSGLAARIGLTATDESRLRRVAESKPKPESRAEFWAKFREPREPAPVRNTRPGAKQNNGDAA